MAQNVTINGVTYSDVPSVSIPKSGGGTANFYDTTNSNALASDLLTGKTAYSANGVITGTIPLITPTATAITTKAQEVTIAQGYHDGTGTVAIDSVEQDKIVASNIKSGVTILGVSGSSMVIDTIIASNPITAANVLNGYSGYANGSLITGSATVPTVSQDSSTKILSIE